MGLDGLGGRLPGELSGGQGQRIALARALIARPRVVFADEPTGSLDSVAADEVMELLVETARTQGTAVLVVTHESRVAGFADRTVLMRDGVESVRVNGAHQPVGGETLRVGAGEAERSPDTISSSGRRGLRDVP
jgi:ABC-type lipoprotein export system ATPase subunit